MAEPGDANWEWQPLIYMGDAARAGSNAFKAEFENPDDLDNTSIRVMTCFAHVAAIWTSRGDHKAKLRDMDNLAKIKSDLANLNFSMFDARMVVIARGLMMRKWRTVYKEPEWCDAFVRAWQGSTFTRAEANHGWYGGLPSDNNMLESTNNVIKKALERDLPSLTTLVPRAAEWLRDNAVSDDAFGLLHNRKASCPSAWPRTQIVPRRQSPQLQQSAVHWIRAGDIVGWGVRREVSVLP
jgi:hypothetical protein